MADQVVYTLAPPDIATAEDFRQCLIDDDPFFATPEDARDGIKDEYRDKIPHMRVVKLTIEFLEN